MDPSTSNSKPTGQWKYDVFLSFRGSDTRRSFTDHLYATLIRRGIKAYKDDIDLDRGKNISELLQAINDSRFSIVVFSKNYAASSWCLDELVTIIECVGLGKHTVVPVFYDVDPSEVSEQSGGYGVAFKGHEESFKNDVEMVKKWRHALTSVADHSGWDLKDRHEVEFIEDVVEDILKKLRKLSDKFSSLETVLVGLDNHLLRMDEYLSVGLNDVRFIGICGMGGIGKTTIARAVYEKFSSQFEGGSFVGNVRETTEKYGLVRSQEQLLSEILYEKNIKIWDTYRGSKEIRDRLCHKTVLIVLDDVSQIEQLESLAGAQSWFGAGSRIIITTRDEHLLITHGTDNRYRVEEMAENEALQLFCLKAFRNERPTSYHLELANEFVKYAKGLPLALDVLGRFVDGKKIEEWKSALDRLKKIPNKNVSEKLEISFHGLEELEQKIFLDIACFFKGKDQGVVIRILESCGFDPIIGLRVLIDKSLISIFDNNVWMHDLLQEMGQDIVRRESPEPGSRSRLWHYRDVYDVLSNDTGTEKIEGVMVQDACEQDGNLNDKALNSEVFLKMRRLRLLKLKYILHWRDINNLPNTLRYLDWIEYPLKSFPAKFQMDNLVELHMQHSKIRRFWKATKVLRTLKVIDLSYSVDLVNTPDFTKLPNLEELNLRGCISLPKIDRAIGDLQKLVFLNLRDCKNLLELPDSICDLKSLKTLNLNGCSKLNKLPDGLGKLTCLEKLYMNGISERPQTSTKLWDFLKPWQLLSRKSSKTKALMLPSLSNLSSLKTLNLSYCNLKEVAVLDNLRSFPLLQALDLCGNDFVSLPTRINQLSKLKTLLIADCKKLESLPDLPSSIISISINGCSSLKSLPNLLELPTSDYMRLNFVNCYKLVETYGRDSLTFMWLIHFLRQFPKQSPEASVLGPGHWYRQFYFTLCLPGGGIPWWFGNVYVGTSMRVNLPPFWCNIDWMGFALCASFGPQHEVTTLKDDNTNYYIACFLRGNSIHYPDCHYIVTFNRKTYPISDQLWLLFLPRAMYAEAVIPLMGKCSIMSVFYKVKGLDVKECAIRLVYKQDIEELIQCYGGSNNLILSYPDDKKKKRPVDEGCSISEVGECSEGLPAKRPRTSPDIDREEKGKCIQE